MTNEKPTRSLTDIEERVYKAFEKAGFGEDLTSSSLKDQIRVLATEPLKRSDTYARARKYIFEHIGNKSEDMVSAIRVGTLHTEIERILGEAK